MGNWRVLMNSLQFIPFLFSKLLVTCIYNEIMYLPKKVHCLPRSFHHIIQFYSQTALALSVNLCLQSSLFHEGKWEKWKKWGSNRFYWQTPWFTFNLPGDRQLFTENYSDTEILLQLQERRSHRFRNLEGLETSNISDVYYTSNYFYTTLGKFLGNHALQRLILVTLQMHFYNTFF